MSRTRPVSAAIGGLALLGCVLAGCTSGGGPEIVVAAVTRSDVVETVDAAGMVTPRSQAVLTSPDDAVVATVLVNEGQRVAEGDVLVQLSSVAVQGRLSAARKKLADTPATASTGAPDLQALARQLDASALAGFASARAAARQINDRDAREQALEQIDQAERSYRANRAAASRAIQQTENGIANASAALAALNDAQHDAAAAGVAAAEAAVAALTVRAPFAGTVTLGGPAPGSSSAVDLSGIAQSLGGALPGALGELSSDGSGPDVTTALIEPGAHVSSGTPVATVVDATSLSVTANVDETDILSVKRGDVASVDLDAVPGASYPGTVVSIDQLPATTAGGSVTYKVRMSLRSGTDAGGHLAAKPRAGMSAVARITVQTSRDAVTVPAAAIVRDTSGRDAVWVVRSGRAHLTFVDVGAQGPDTIAVDSGLADDDRVVVKGADSVKEGQKLS